VQPNTLFPHVKILPELSRSLMLRPTFSRPLYLGIKHPSGAGLLMWGALSDERTGLSLTIAAGSVQRSHSRVRVPWDSRLFYTVSDSRLPFSSPPRLAGLRWRYSIPPPHGSVPESSILSAHTKHRKHSTSIFVCLSVGVPT
jgi:hypothetical protein